MENANEISQLVASLPTLDRPGLVEQWKKQFGSPPHAKLRIELMRPVLAYRIQENAAGQNTRSTRWRLQDHSPSAQTARFKAGTRIVREWNGKIHEVSVTDDGYEYQGETFKSLSPIATRITGTKWSGPAFFGTKPKGGSK
jgi:Protein of unknown function (DUF2924)